MSTRAVFTGLVLLLAGAARAAVTSDSAFQQAEEKKAAAFGDYYQQVKAGRAKTHAQAKVLMDRTITPAQSSLAGLAKRSGPDLEHPASGKGSAFSGVRGGSADISSGDGNRKGGDLRPTYSLDGTNIPKSMSFSGSAPAVAKKKSRRYLSTSSR